MPGIPVARVVAVIAETESGTAQVGSGYLLDATRVLTAWHCTIDGETGQAAPRLTATRADGGGSAAVTVAEAAPDLDVALLAVVDDPPWDAKLPGEPVAFGKLDRDHTGQLDDCEAVGFPRWQESGSAAFRDKAEIHGVIRALEGREPQRLVLRDPILSGIAGYTKSPWSGFSGASVFYHGLLLGVVIEHHPRQGDTALQIRPVEAIARADDSSARRLAEALGIDRNDALRPVTAGPRRWRAEDAGESALTQWGWSLDRDEEGVRHWRPRARGVGINSERGWRFRGRAAALTKITSWLEDPRPTSKVLVVTGDPGSGKSAVLGRIVTTADAAVRASLPPGDTGVLAAEGSVSCAVHAKGKTALDIAAEIAHAAQARTPREPGDLAPMLQEALSERPGVRFNVVIDALDETSGPDQAREIIGAVVLPLAETCSDSGVRVVVGTRRQGDGINLLDRFGPALDLLDLDKPRYFEEGDLADYTLACLRAPSGDQPDSPYADEAVARPLAARISEMAGRNFLVAGLVARTHGLHDRVAADPGHLKVTTSVRTALEGYLRRLAPVGDATAGELLTALAFAEEPGLPISLWRLAVQTLSGKIVSDLALAQFIRSPAANFLIETTVGTETAYRLFHQALSDALLKARKDSVAISMADEYALASSFIVHGRDTGWIHAPAYLLRSLPAHAARVGLTDELLTDDAYLLHADLRRVLRIAGQAVSPSARNHARLIGLTPEAAATGPAERAALFGVTEAVDGLGTAYRNSSRPTPYRALWASANSRHTGLTLRVPGDKLGGVCTINVGGQILLATDSDSGTVRLWDPADGALVRTLNTGQTLARVICTVEIGGRPLLATGNDNDTIALWDPADGTLVRTLETGQDTLTAVCIVETGTGPLLATSGSRGSVSLRDPSDGTLVRTLNTGEILVWTMCAVEVAGQTLLAIGSAGSAGRVQLWNPADGSQSNVFDTGMEWILAACTTVVSGQTLLAIGGVNDGRVELRDPADGSRVRTLDTGQFRVRTMCAVDVHGETMLATNGDDGTVQLCDLCGVSSDRESPARQGVVGTICAVDAGNRPLFASSGKDGTVQLWNPADGTEVDVLDDGLDQVLAMSAVEVFGRPLLAASGDTGIIRLWSPVSGVPVTVLDTGQEMMVALCAITVVDRILIATGGYDGTVELWDPADGTRVRVLGFGAERVKAVCAVEVYGQTLLAAGNDGGMVGLWDPADGTPVRVLDTGQSVVETVCAVEADDRTLLAVGGDDRTVGLWDPADGTLVHSLDTGQNWIHAMCVVEIGGRTLLVTGGDGGMVHLWNPTNGTCILAVPVHRAVRSAASAGNILAIGLEAGLLVIELNANALRKTTADSLVIPEADARNMVGFNASGTGVRVRAVMDVLGCPAVPGSASAYVRSTLPKSRPLGL